MTHPKTTRPALLALLAAVTCAAGCGKSDSGESGWTLNNLVKKLMGPTPKQRVAMAFDTEDPDRRREGIIALSKEKWGLREPYLKGYAAILRTDTDPLVRAAAVRALGKAGDPNYTPDVTRSLYDKSDTVRQDAAAALDRVGGDVAVGPLRDRAVKDADQDVRAHCARALRHYPREDAYRSLIECLADKDFAVRHQAHASLVELTGQDLGFEADGWAGATLEGLRSRRPPEKPKRWWQRLGRKKQPATRPAGADGG